MISIRIFLLDAECCDDDECFPLAPLGSSDEGTVAVDGNTDRVVLVPPPRVVDRNMVSLKISMFVSGDPPQMLVVVSLSSLFVRYCILFSSEITTQKQYNTLVSFGFRSTAAGRSPVASVI